MKSKSARFAWLMCGALPWGCGIVEVPKDQCVVDSDCNSGRVCREGICGPPEEGYDASDTGLPAVDSCSPDRGNTGCTCPQGAGPDGKIYVSCDPMACPALSCKQGLQFFRDSIGCGCMPVSTPTDEGGADGPGMPAACQANDGPVRGFSRMSEVDDYFAGKWVYCSGGGDAAFFQQAVEFTADGHWYVLLPGPSGMLERQVGFGKAGTYALGRNSGEVMDGGAPADAGFSVPVSTFSVLLVDNVAIGYHIYDLSFSDSPSKMLFDGGIYVPVK